jgi:hypothetical protein
MRISRLFLIAAPLALVGGWYWASPYWTLRGMRDAVQAKDVDALAAYVDFPALRADVKPQISANMLAVMSKEMGSLGPLGKVFGPTMVDKLADGIVDSIISPTGLRLMFEGNAIADGAKQAPVPLDTSDADIVVTANGPSPLFSAFPMQTGDAAIERIGLSEFKLRNTKPGHAPAVLIFHRDGLGWKLAGIDLRQRAR